MTTKHSIFSILACLCCLITFGQYYGSIHFIENKGQWDSRVRFMAQVPSGEVYIHQTGFTIVQHNADDWEVVTAAVHPGHGADHSNERRMYTEGGGTGNSGSNAPRLRSHAYRVDFAGASSKASLTADKPLNNFNNYILGNDPSKWAFDCKLYQGITVHDVYPNVDVRYYSENGFLKYDLIVRPGGNPDQIKLQYTGVNGLAVKGKELLIPTSVGTLKEMPPYTYQYEATGKKEISNKFLLTDSTVRFGIKAYNKSLPLVIDPTLIFCSLSGSTRDNWGFTATYGPDGSFYGGGISLSGGFPVSTGAFQQEWGGGDTDPKSDIVIIKLTPDGTQRVYATYIGGSGNEQPHSLIVDAQGNLVIAGRTNSPATAGNGGLVYPVTGPGFGPLGDHDIIITKLNATGTALIGSRRIGGKSADGVNINASRGGTNSLQQNYGDDGRSEVILDGSGNVYVTGSTQSDDFFTRNAAQSAKGGLQDAVLIKMTPDLSDVIFSTYLGGSGNDAGYVLAINPTDGNVYAAGGTESSNFPGNKAGSIYPASQGRIDGYIAMFNPAGTLLKSTYLGTNGIDQVYGIQFDRFGFPYVMGQTTGDWPVVNATYSNAGAKQFIAKLQPNLSGYVYSTVFGKAASIPSISPTAFLVDRCENVYVSGWGGIVQQNYPSSLTTGLPTTADAIKSRTDGQDFYFFVLRKNASGQLFGSFFGQDGGGSEHVDGGTSRFDRNGVIYQAMCANCRQLGVVPFPTTPGSWSPTNPSPGCNLGMLKFEMNFSGVRSGPESAINGVPRDSAGCVPLTVDFSDTVLNAFSYEWTFGDGSPQITTTVPNASHTYTQIGSYRVMLVAIDSTTCNIRDTSYTTIRVGANKANVDFNPVKLEPCQAFSYRFDNLAQSSSGQFSANAFEWDFGDGSPKQITGTQPVFHQYTNAGTYNVTLTLLDTNFCNVGDVLTKVLRVSALVDARVETPLTGCAPYTATFNNVSLGGQTFQWSFGDGATSTDVSPVHTYNQPGTYVITMVATDPNTCNVVDSTSVRITVSGVPTVTLSASPQPPIENTPIVFTPVVSPDVVRYQWYFGDGDSLITTAGGPVSHEYNATGQFNACVIVSNQAGCTDTACVPVETLIRTAVDVPTAFTPNSGDVNSVVMVRGYGIAKMRFIIWNRWGTKVFETADRRAGWNGRYNGTLQPMDVYAYTLEVEFFDGTRTTKKGDITLIR